MSAGSDNHGFQPSRAAGVRCRLARPRPGVHPARR